MRTRIFLMLFIITSTSTLWAQSQLTPTRIDVSEYFEKINKCNTIIKEANINHYTVSKRFNTRIGAILVGLGGGLYSLDQVSKTENELWYTGVGVFLGTLISGIFGSTDDTAARLEEMNLSDAKEILEELKTGKKITH